jgi:hypothetical protein
LWCRRWWLCGRRWCLRYFWERLILGRRRRRGGYRRLVTPRFYGAFTADDLCGVYGTACAVVTARNRSAKARDDEEYDEPNHNCSQDVLQRSLTAFAIPRGVVHGAFTYSDGTDSSHRSSGFINSVHLRRFAGQGRSRHQVAGLNPRTHSGYSPRLAKSPTLNVGWMISSSFS